MSHGSGPARLRFGLVSRPHRSVALQLKRPNRTEPITRADRLFESSRLTEIDHFQSFEIGSFDCSVTPHSLSSLLKKHLLFIEQWFNDWKLQKEEADWAGLTLKEAERKYNAEQYASPVPLKDVFREQLLLELQSNRLRRIP